VIDTLPVRRRLIGSALRRYRQHLGFGLEEPARILDCDKSKVSRIETGQRGIRVKELRELLSEYGVGEYEQRALAVIADPRSARRGWWQEYADVIPASYQDYLIIEAAASEAMIYDAQQVPEVLRVQDYARAVAEADPGMLEPDTVDRLTAMNLARQQVIIGDKCTALSVVIGEGALRQVVGGPDVMRAQLRWLAEVSTSCPWVIVQVVPFNGGAHPNGGCGQMTILRFAQAPSLGVVHLPGMSAGSCLVEQAEVASHVRAFTQLQVSALTPEKSARMLQEMAG
jgi:transcriptional regulator with XRE-family HTH domain